MQRSIHRRMPYELDVLLLERIFAWLKVWAIELGHRIAGDRYVSGVTTDHAILLEHVLDVALLSEMEGARVHFGDGHAEVNVGVDRAVVVLGLFVSSNS